MPEDLFVYLVPFLVLFFAVSPILLGLIFGVLNEKSHLRSLEEREEKLKVIRIFNNKRPLEGYSYKEAQLCQGNAVYAADSFKGFIASLNQLVGGRVVGYEMMVERTRREAILRMKEQAHQRGANMILNVRLETSTLGRVSGSGKGVSSVEVLAYGTSVQAE